MYFHVIGDNLGYWLARRYGTRVLYNLGFRKRMESPNYKKLEIKIKVTKAKLLEVIVNHGILTGTHSKREFSAQTLVA